MFPKQCVHTEGSYGSCKGRCLIRVLTLGRGIFLVNFRIKWLLSNLDMRFDCAGSHKVGVRVLGRGIFLVNFRINWLLFYLDMRFERAGSHKMCVCVLGSFTVKC